MENLNLPIPIQTMMIFAPTSNIYYPQIQWLKNPVIQNKVNRAIIKKVKQMFNKSYQQNYITGFTGGYEVKNNQRGILSLTMNTFASGPKLAHPIDQLTSLTTDVRTGKLYSLADLFTPDSAYIERLSAIISAQINKRNISTFQEFDIINSNQSFYIADKMLMIYFKRYEIAPRPFGYPTFPISIYEINDIINKDGPLGLMLSDY